MFERIQNIEMNDEYIRKIFLVNINKIRTENRRLLLPPPDISVWELADLERILPSDAPRPGKWITKEIPHTRGMMVVFSNPTVHHISCMASSQILKTESLILNPILWFIVTRPANIMIMFPTDNDIKAFSKERLMPMINGCRLLRNKVHSKKENGERNSSVRLSYPGGHLEIISGSSASGTRQRSIQITMADDVDKLTIGQQREGDPLTRLRKRTTAYKKFGKDLNIDISTPTRTKQSRIAAEYERSNMMKYHVTCPHCGTQFYFKHERLVWKKDKDMFGKVIKEYPDTAVYPCDGCGAEINEAERLKMLEGGVWIAERPEIKKHVGFWINELSSTLSSFAEVANQIVDAGTDPEKLEVLWNTVFGLPFEAGEGEKADIDSLKNHIEPFIDRENPFIVPNEILYAVQTTDVQKDRLETMIIGVGMDKELWILLYQKIYGDTLRPNSECWRTNDEIYKANWRRKDGVKVPLLRHFKDTGYLAPTVYKNVRKKHTFGIYPVKGKGGIGVPILPHKFQPVDFDQCRLLHLGSNAAKQELFRMLSVQRPEAIADDEPVPNYVHFPDSYFTEELLEQFQSEVAVKKQIGNLEYVVYVKPDRHTSNELIDLMYMGIAAIYHVNANEKLVKQNMDKQAEKIAKTRSEKLEARSQNEVDAKKEIQNSKLKIQNSKKHRRTFARRR